MRALTGVLGCLIVGMSYAAADAPAPTSVPAANNAPTLNATEETQRNFSKLPDGGKP